MRLAHFIWILLAVSLLTAGCQTAKSPFPESYRGVRLDDIAKLREGDTVSVVIEKLGSPAHVEVIVPWLMYSATDKEGSYYRVAFALQKTGELQPEDKLTRVTLTSGLFDGEVPTIVWPAQRPAKK
jgi:hypothetical protein